MASHDAIERYLAFLDDPANRYEGHSRVKECIYTPRSSLLRYFTGNSIGELLNAASQDDEQTVAAETVLEEYLVTFTILLSIGHGLYLPRFIEKDYSDERLPFIDRPRHFPKTETGSFFDTFFDAQWRFCPVRLSRTGVNIQLEPEQIIPVVNKVMLSKTGFEIVSRVELLRGYDLYSATEHGQNGVDDEMTAGTKIDQTTHNYIFKEFPETAKTEYDRELAAFLHLQKSSSVLGNTVVGFNGSFVHDGLRTIVLEDAAKGSLNEYMFCTAPPTKAEDITRLWESLLNFHETMQAIHNMEAPQSPEIKNHSMLRGWHGNINPQSISVYAGSSGSDITFRLNEIGISSWDPAYMAFITSQGQALDHQMDDIWDLGCVYSEFAVWIVLGLAGLKDYRMARTSEQSDSSQEAVPGFINEQGLLPCVRDWHEQVIDSKRNSDRVTEDVLNKMVEEMLSEDTEGRPNARQLKVKANKILDKAKGNNVVNRNRSVASPRPAIPRSTSSSNHRQSAMSFRSDDSQAFMANGRHDSSGLMSSNSSVTSGSRQDNLGTPIEEEKEFVAALPTRQFTNQVSPTQSSSHAGPLRANTTAQAWLKYQSQANNHASPSNRPTPASVTDEVSRATTAMLNGDDMEAVVRKPLPQRPPQISQSSTHSDRPAPLRITSQSNTASPIHPPPEPTHDIAAIPNSPTSNAPTEDLPEYTPFDEPLEIRPDSDPRGPTTLPPANTTTTRSTGSISAHRVSTASLSLDRTPSLPSQPRTRHQSQTSTTTSPPRRPPHMSLLDALFWLNSRKESASYALLPHESCLNILSDRDFIFLVDDSRPMISYTRQVSHAVRMMSWLLKRHDHGITLYFSHNEAKIQTRSNHSSDLQKPLMNTLAAAHGRPDISISLARILREYLATLKTSNTDPTKTKKGFGRKNSVVERPRKIIIYVLSDCSWVGDAHPVGTLLEETGRKLEQMGFADGMVGVQFLRCGENGYGQTEQDIAGQMETLRGWYAGKVLVDCCDVEENVFRDLIGCVSSEFEEWRMLREIGMRPEERREQVEPEGDLQREVMAAGDEVQG